MTNAFPSALRNEAFPVGVVFASRPIPNKASPQYLIRAGRLPVATLFLELLEKI